MTATAIRLRGCRPQPLMSYLKALGILRLVSEQADAGARGFWGFDCFQLVTSLDKASLAAYFLERYEPTPILAPWNGGSGFYPGDSKEALNYIIKSESPRLRNYREALQVATGLLKEMGVSTKPGGETKRQLMKLCRQRLPDAAVAWLDCTYLLSAEKTRFPPILGTGANDGRLEFSNNFMQRLSDVTLEGRSSASERWLDGSLFGESVKGLVPASVGQFAPGGVGGPNATAGFEASPMVNPWDYVLMIEGSLFFAGSISRRLDAEVETRGIGAAAFPFTVDTSRAGAVSAISPGPREDSRGELWLPIWRKPASLRELDYLFSEGRTELRGGRVRYGTDFARALASLGVDRGIDAFERYSFVKRSGKAFLAVPLGRYEATERPDSVVLGDLDAWLGRLRRAASSSSSPSWLSERLRAVEGAAFDFFSLGGKERFQDILIAVAAAERSIAASPAAREIVRFPLRLSPEWVVRADDGSAEFRLAASLASLRQPALRVNLEPVRFANGRYLWANKNRSSLWSESGLVHSMLAVLRRRTLDAGAPSLSAWSYAGLNDIELFLSARVDDRRIEGLAWALSMVDWNGGMVGFTPGQDPSPLLPRSYALLKLLFLPQPLEWDSTEHVIREQPEVLPRLITGSDAIGPAVRRLRASGLIPAAGDVEVPHASDRRLRLAASLLFPVSRPDVLARMVLTRSAVD